MAHYFCTTGAVTAQFPLAAQIDTGSTTGTTTYADGFFKANTSVMLRAIVFRTATPAADTITLVDKAGNTITAFGVASNPAFRGIPLPVEGIPMPLGGFGVTVTGANDLMFCFDYQASVV